MPKLGPMNRSEFSLLVEQVASFVLHHSDPGSLKPVGTLIFGASVREGTKDRQQRDDYEHGAGNYWPPLDSSTNGHFSDMRGPRPLRSP
jgi:hypothetical protein